MPFLLLYWGIKVYEKLNVGRFQYSLELPPSTIQCFCFIIFYIIYIFIMSSSFLVTFLFPFFYAPTLPGKWYTCQNYSQTICQDYESKHYFLKHFSIKSDLFLLFLMITFLNNPWYFWVKVDLCLSNMASKIPSVYFLY